MILGRIPPQEDDMLPGGAAEDAVGRVPLARSHVARAKNVIRATIVGGAEGCESAHALDDRDGRPFFPRHSQVYRAGLPELSESARARPGRTHRLCDHVCRSRHAHDVNPLSLGAVSGARHNSSIAMAGQRSSLSSHSRCGGVLVAGGERARGFAALVEIAAGDSFDIGAGRDVDVGARAGLHVDRREAASRPFRNVAKIHPLF